MRITVIVIIKIFLSVSRINCDATVQSEDDLKQRETLRLGMLFSQKGALDFSGLIPTIEIALETIEADKTLPFTFAYTYNDSMCQAATSVRGFIEQVYSSSPTSPQIMLIGADCSVATEPVAEISHTELEPRTDFPSFIITSSI